jgi:mRNA interferase YafQ
VRIVARTNRFKKDYKLAVKRRKNIRKLLQIVERLTKGENLEPKFRDHALEGEYLDCRECHIESDWLLIYMITPNDLILIRKGSHSDLFE